MLTIVREGAVRRAGRRTIAYDRRGEEDGAGALATRATPWDKVEHAIMDGWC